MRSRTVHLPAEPSRAALAAAAEEAGRDPDFALAFLPPEGETEAVLAALAEAWPGSLRFGCEAVTQFADAAMTTEGSVQLFWLDHPGHGATVEVVAGSHDEPPARAEVDALAARLAGADGVLLLVDGLRFPAERFLADLRRSLRRLIPPAAPRIAGGLASQREPVVRAGARVFLGDRILPSSCLAVALRGVAMRVEVVRGWSPASPIYTVTRAEGSVLWEIDGAPATDWYRRFFTIDGELAPMPETAYRFPLILEGPGGERRGLYRTLRFFDQPPGAVTLWGGVETGDRVRLGMGNDLSLVRTASELSGAGEAEAAILYSCVGREMVLGERADQEVAAIHRALGGVALSGFFTFGEIGPTLGGDLAFYNHTAILVLLAETPP
jgi:hypothetical protein